MERTPQRRASSTMKKEKEKPKRGKQNETQQLLMLLGHAIQQVAGKSAVDLAGIIYGKRDLNEFIIAKKIRLTINQTRNILYKLLEAGMVSFTRKKDKDKAWYTYFWTLDPLKALGFSEQMLKKEGENFRKQAHLRKTRRFYICKNCGIEVNEETALINDFTCTECGNVYELNEDKKLIDEIQGKINQVEKNIAQVRAEMDKLKAQEVKEAGRLKEKKKPVKKKTSSKKKKVG